MGYQITYHLQEIKKTKLKKAFPLWGKIALLTLFMITGHFLLVVLQTVLGGQWQQTLSASEQMAEALQNGANIRDALQVFCTELMP